MSRTTPLPIPSRRKMCSPLFDAIAQNAKLPAASAVGASTRAIADRFKDVGASVRL